MLLLTGELASMLHINRQQLRSLDALQNVNGKGAGKRHVLGDVGTFYRCWRRNIREQ
jgi:hypothetical protein